MFGDNMKKTNTPTNHETPFDFAAVNAIPNGLEDKYPNGLTSRQTAKILNLEKKLRTVQDWLKAGVIKGEQPQNNGHYSVTLESVSEFATKMSWRVRWELLE
jgi:hypothetical protein